MSRQGRKQAIAAGAAIVAAALIAACSSSTPASVGAGPSAGASPLSRASGTINASGSTFQLTFQQVAIQAFKSVAPNITVNYSGVGSGTGRSNLAAGTVRFAGSDSPVPASEAASFTDKKILYFPILIGPITVAYNLPGASDLKLTPTVIAGIFQGGIKTWNDPAITAVNRGVSLPGTPITVAVRSDSSGTTQNFSLFLQTAAPGAWKLGSSSTVKWPSSARAASGNGGVASIIQKTPGAIGYVDFTDAVAARLAFASVQNSSGAFVAPSASAASASAAGVAVSPDLTFHAVWGPGARAYPITYQSWDLVNARQPSKNDATLLKAYLGFLLSPQGQAMLGPLNYAPLPSSIQRKAVAQLSQITG